VTVAPPASITMTVTPDRGAADFPYVTQIDQARAAELWAWLPKTIDASACCKVLRAV